MNKACGFSVRFTYHSLRHTFAREMFRNKIDVQIDSRILGHKDVATTRRIYIHVSTEMEKEALDDVFGK